MKTATCVIEAYHSLGRASISKATESADRDAMKKELEAAIVFFEKSSQELKFSPMVSQAKVKLYGSKSRHSINLPSDFVRDSAFPLKVGEELVARIEDSKVIIEKKQ